MEQQQQANDSSSAPSGDQLQIIDAQPLTMVLPNVVKQRRMRRSKQNLKDATPLGLPEGWYYEQRPRTNVNYVGKVDQFFYEPGTNKQFRSMKSVEKYLESKGQKINPVTPEAMQGNEQHKNETTPPPLAPISFDVSNANSKSPNPESSNKKNKNKDKNKKKISREKAIADLNFNFKEAPKEVTWVLSDAKNDKWASFMGHLNVQESVEKYWYEAFKVINGMNEEDHENGEDDKDDDAASDDDDHK